MPVGGTDGEIVRAWFNGLCRPGRFYFGEVWVMSPTVRPHLPSGEVPGASRSGELAEGMSRWAVYGGLWRPGGAPRGSCNAERQVCDIQQLWTQPAWNSDGSKPYYFKCPPPCEVMVVETKIRNGFSAGNPRSLFTTKSIVGTPVRFCDTDGRRFLMNETQYPAGLSPVTRIEIVLNWLEELKRLVPVK